MSDKKYPVYIAEVDSYGVEKIFGVFSSFEKALEAVDKEYKCGDDGYDNRHRTYVEGTWWSTITVSNKDTHPKLIASIDVTEYMVDGLLHRLVGTKTP